ncbi:MAG TPA: hypothetical protein PKA41_12895 [Verrucomicrobiota bacterium]|nr:hypothetical protein [Verrucomicrobiota bacterium]
MDNSAAILFGAKSLMPGGLGRTVLRVTGDNSQQYLRLLDTPLPAEIGPTARDGTRPAAELDAELERLSFAAGFSPQRRQLVRALVLLWHDHLNESHSIAQGIENADGSYVHAIMHRREPDYWNAKYWFRRVGKHPAFGKVAQRVEELLEERGAGELRRKLLPRGGWDAFAFVDACENGEGGCELLREVQKIEFIALLEHFLDDDTTP